MLNPKYFPTVLILISATITNAQGIRFEKALSWKDVLSKAKSENKYIFVDCYSTWCGPCKEMEREVYPLPEVGGYYNRRFISVKLQMDKTENDDSLTRKWRPVADQFQSTYAINAFPTFLFFDPSGTPVHKVVGGQSANNFIRIAKDAQVPEKQYYSILKNYVPGKLDTGELKGLAQQFAYDNKELAGKMVMDYFDRTPKNEWISEGNLQFLAQLNTTKQAAAITYYILRKENQQLSSKNELFLYEYFKNDSLIQLAAYNQLKALSKTRLKQETDLQLLAIFKGQQGFKDIADSYIGTLTTREALSKGNINLMRSFMRGSSDKSFSIFLKHPVEIDTVMHTPYYSEIVLCKIIAKENVDPEIKNARSLHKEPDWNSIGSEIETKYGKTYAERCVITAKPAYYRDIKRWTEYAKAIVRYVDTYAPIESKSAFYLNNMAYEVFENTDDSNDLKRANHWMDVALQSDTANGFYGSYMATKAEVLYKLGRQRESIDLMTKAIAIDKAKRHGRADEPWYGELNQMKKGEHIWPEKAEGK